MKKIIIGVIIVIIAMIGYVIYSNIQKEQEKQAHKIQLEDQARMYKENESFAMDVIKALGQINENNKSVDNDIEDDWKQFEVAYTRKENILNAKDVMTKWIDDSDEFKAGVSREMVAGIDDLISSEDAAMRVLKEDSDSEEATGLFLAKLENGREKVFVSSLKALADEENTLILSEESKDEIIHYIDILFKEDLDQAQQEWLVEHDDLENIILPNELWAALMIKNHLLQVVE
jgi:hypothetical protein